MYLALLRTLEGLDPSAAHSTVLLRPVKAFLRSRLDTIACLMRMLLKDGMGRWGVSVRMTWGPWSIRHRRRTIARVPAAVFGGLQARHSRVMPTPWLKWRATAA